MFLLLFFLLFNLTCMPPLIMVVQAEPNVLRHIGIEPHVQPQREDVANVDKADEQPEIEHIDLRKPENPKDSPEVKPSNKQDPPKSVNNNADKQAESSSTKEVKSSSLKPEPVLPNYKGDVQSGALLRGFYVFLGLSVVVMVYFIFRSYRLRRGIQPSTTVRKYGVTARRSDMEMRPLELDEEDDDTLFDIGTQNINR